MRAYIYDWVRTLAAYFIFMTMILNFIPEGQYRKYVRYFFSLLLLLLLSRPLGELTGWEERMNKSLEELQDGLAGQKSLGAGLYVEGEDRQLMEQVCQERIREQAEELLAEYGLELAACVSRVELDGEPGIRFIQVRARSPDDNVSGLMQNRNGDAAQKDNRTALGLQDSETDTVQRIRERLMGMYELRESQVMVYLQ